MAKKNRIFGVHPIMEALKSGAEFDKIFIQKESQGEALKEIIHTAKSEKVSFQFVPKEKLNRLTSKNHQGVVGFLSLVEYQDLERIIPMIFENGQLPMLVALDGVTDVRNLGAIARTAECTGVNALILPQKGSAAINEDAIKTSSGAFANLSVCRVTNIKDALLFCQQSGLQILCASEKAAEVVYEADFTKPTVLVMGGEESGISNDIIRLADGLIKLPILGKTGSLNVSVACGAILYEAIRQKDYNLR